MATKTSKTTKQTAETPQLSGRLTNAQREIIKLFTLDLTASEMKKLKKMLEVFLDEITQEQLDKYVESGKYTIGKKLANEHLRTPYV